VGKSPEEGHKNGQRDGTPFLEGQAERVDAIQHGEEKALGDFIAAFQYLNGAYKKDGEKF